MSQDEIKAFAAQLAEQLDEKGAVPRRMLADVVKHCGIEFAQEILKLTFETEAQGGLMINTGERRRTLGGVFFFLARSKLTPEMRKVVFPRKKGQNRSGGNKTGQSQYGQSSSLRWEDRLEIIQPLLAAQGELTNVKIVLIGRPGRIETRKDLVVTVVSHTQKSPSLPRGVPAPPKTPTTYTVYIAAKQWRRVEDAIKNSDDALIIEGTCSYDEAIKGIAVFASSVTTKALEAQKREAQKAKTVSASGETPAENTPVTQETDSRFPPEVAQKLQDLRTSAELFRQKISGLQGKPPDQQFGLEMTQKLLSNVEREIAALEKQYAK